VLFPNKDDTDDLAASCFSEDAESSVDVPESFSVKPTYVSLPPGLYDTVFISGAQPDAVTIRPARIKAVILFFILPPVIIEYGE
jgi:hypothetical protein